MKLILVKPDLTYYDKYNEMMKEWCDSNTQIAPWFLEKKRIWNRNFKINIRRS